jgi:hypothetical protein
LKLNHFSYAFWNDFVETHEDDINKEFGFNKNQEILKVTLYKKKRLQSQGNEVTHKFEKK